MNPNDRTVREPLGILPDGKLNVVDRNDPRYEPSVEGVEYSGIEDGDGEEDDDLSDLDEIEEIANGD